MAEAPNGRSESQQGPGSERQTDLSMRSETEDEDEGHEVETLPGVDKEEVECSAAWRKCSKNWGHENFIPVSKFVKEHLPVRAQSQENMDYITAYIGLTVRLKVTYTSFERPDGYPNAGLRGMSNPRYGTGWVTDYNRGEGTCQCSACRVSPSPCQEWYKIELRTARHTVYSEDEVESAEVNFFYDDEKSMTDGRVKTVYGSDGYCWMNGHGDDCFFFCVFHDKDLAGRLKKVWEKLHASDTIHGDNDVAVIISHPHGEPKLITVGDSAVYGFSAMSTSITEDLFFSYTAETCGGSSGAPVLMLGNPKLFFYPLPHRKSWNQSVNVSIRNRDPSYDEDESSCHEVEEAVNKSKVCTKKSGHKTFIPAPKFNIEHLPLRVQKEENVNCIKAYSDLTVRLRVTHTSRQRPEGYPFYKDGATNSTRCGSGWVEAVSIKSSPLDQNWYEIRVRTARLLVYNRDEAKSTEVDFFYDDEETMAEGRVKTVSASDPTDGCQYQWINNNSDDCFFTCVTQDKDLIERLEGALENVAIQEPEEQVVADHPIRLLVVIISHRHGEAKHITVGSTTGMDYSSIKHQGHVYFEYTAGTCPGSSGAPVLVFDSFWNPLTHSHSKVIKLNCSTHIKPMSGTQHFLPRRQGSPTVTSRTSDPNDSDPGGDLGLTQPQLDTSQENPFTDRLKEVVDIATLFIIAPTPYYLRHGGTPDYPLPSQDLRKGLPHTEKGDWLTERMHRLFLENTEWTEAFLDELMNACRCVFSTSFIGTPGLTLEFLEHLQFQLRSMYTSSASQARTTATTISSTCIGPPSPPSAGPPPPPSTSAGPPPPPSTSAGPPPPPSTSAGPPPPPSTSARSPPPPSPPPSAGPSPPSSTSAGPPPPSSSSAGPPSSTRTGPPLPSTSDRPPPPPSSTCAGPPPPISLSARPQQTASPSAWPTATATGGHPYFPIDEVLWTMCGSDDSKRRTYKILRWRRQFLNDNFRYELIPNPRLRDWVLFLLVKYASDHFLSPIA